MLELLDLLSLHGRIVTTDALNCQRDGARRIVAKGGDYVLALKGNHRASDIRSAAKPAPMAGSGRRRQGSTFARHRCHQTAEPAYYLLSEVMSPERRWVMPPTRIGASVNRLHWVLNAVINADQVRHRNDNTAYNKGHFLAHLLAAS